VKLFIIISALLFFHSGKIFSQIIPSDSGQISYVGNVTKTFVDSSRANRNISSLVYYPAVSEGNGAPVLQGNRYNIISFGHGFTLSPNLYISLYRHLASWGYIVIAPATETGFFPSHINFARDLAFVIKDMKRKGRTSGDFFYGVTDSLFAGVFGHSMGGGCSFLAASLDTNIKAVSSLAAANTNPSSVSAASLIKSPVQLLSGQRDSIASYAAHQLPHYNNAYPFRHIVNIFGGNHSQFHLIPGLDDLVDNPAAISRIEQQRITRFYVTSFFNLFLKNDTAYKKFLYGDIAESDTAVNFMYNNFQMNALIQGFYNSVNNAMIKDTVKIYLRNIVSPYLKADSAYSVISDSGYSVYGFKNANRNENYFLHLSHRNSIETWSKAGGFNFDLRRAVYDFTKDSSSAFGNNLVRKGQRYCIYGGDINQDGVTDLQDLGIADNDAFNFSSGYINSDLTGDMITDSEDLSLVDNNAFLFISKILP